MCTTSSTSPKMAATVFMQKPVWRIICFASFLFHLYKCLAEDSSGIDDYLVCQQCGHDVAQARDLMTIPSSMAIGQRNDTILGVKGVLIHKFENPQGVQFELITSKKADVYKHEQVFAEHSWFPNFAWRIVLCPRCGFHLGWAFEPAGHVAGTRDTEHTFLGLILGHLLHQDYADSLLVIPKSYYS